MPKVSIIIVAHNREEFIGKCLDSICDLKNKDFEVVYVDDGSTDRTFDIVLGYSNVLALKALRANKIGPCATRNIGISNSAGEYIAFLDSDCIVESCWLEKTLEAITSKDLDAFSSSVRDLPARNNYEEALVGTSLIGQNKMQARYLVGSNMIFKSAVIKEVMFDEAIAFSEDDDIQIRLQKLGKKINCLNETYTTHNHPIKNWQEFLALCKNRGTGAAQLSYKHNRIPRDIILLPLAFVFLILSTIFKELIIFVFILFFIEATAIIYNELIFKNKSLIGTIRSIHILFLYHLLKAFFFIKKFLNIVLNGDIAIKKSKANWNHILHR